MSDDKDPNGAFAEAGIEVVRLFSPREANETLPLVKRIVGDVNQTGRRLRALGATLGGEARSDPEVKRLMDEIQDLFAELERLGCSYKDWNFEIGLVDFPAVIGGEAVLLCWKSDEPAVAFFHGIIDGFAGRQPIPDVYLTPKDHE